ncbi:MAG: pentapeptide repeat-containing protein [Actinomycetota bacterium]|nr:pentapeptide repeat-containing protein [Actinomycetota bacterium]
MSSRGRPREHRPARPLSNRAIALGAVIVLGIGAAAWTVLLWRYAGAGPAVELDAIRTAGTLIVGAGGFAALLLAARRQRSTELTLEHQREVAAATERDAAEQRITELYTRAVDQLGAEKAPVRLGGLHALERLAQNNPAQRQTIVDVICAYLRMPFTPPDDQAPGEDAPEDAHRRYEQRRQELQVRLTAQRILTAHLNPDVAAVFWADIGLDLTEAYLHEFSFIACHVRWATFWGAKFTGTAYFSKARFIEDAEFIGAEFTKDAYFRDAEFAGLAWFARAKFTEDALFRGTNFAAGVLFGEATFTGSAAFTEAKFAGFAEFATVEFAGAVDFNGAKLAGNTRFDGARVASGSPRVVLPKGWTTRAAQLPEEEEGWLYVVREDESSEQPTEA